jgi:F-type H+-transporting ATPase subunit epsilon
VAGETLTLKVVTPEEVVFEGAVSSVVAPGLLGYLGILRNHAPLVTTFSPGKLTAKAVSGQSHTFRVEEGFLEVHKNRVLVLTDKVLGS